MILSDSEGTWMMLNAYYQTLITIKHLYNKGIFNDVGWCCIRCISRQSEELLNCLDCMTISTMFSSTDWGYQRVVLNVRSGTANNVFNLTTFALIVSAHPYCARNSLRDVMPRHVLSARAVEEMWRYIALVGTLISMHGFNSLKCSVTPYFLLIDHFLCRLSTFCEKLKKICIVEV